MPRTTAPAPQKVETLTSETLGKRKVMRWQFAGPYAFLGKLVAVFYLVVYGPPGAGKSTWVMGLARALADLGDVLYVSAEEEHSPTIADRIRRMDAGHAHLHIRPYVTVEDILETVRTLKVRFVVLDSATAVDTSSKAVHDLWQKLRAMNVALVAVGHVTTEGKMKGGSYLGHDTHTVVRIENGLAVAEKNRYQTDDDRADVAFSAKQVKAAGGYGFTVFDKDDTVWAKNPGDWSDASRAAMFIRLRESGEYDEGLANRSPRRSNRSGGTGGGSAAPRAASTPPKATAKPSAKPSATTDGDARPAFMRGETTATAQTSFTDAQARRILAIAAEDKVRDGKNRYDVVSRHTDAKGRTLFVTRGADGDLVFVYVDAKGGITRQPGRDEAAVARLGPAGPLPADPGPEPKPETPAPKARRTAAAKPAAKTAAAPKPNRALSDAEKALARIEKTLTAALAKKK